MCMVVIIVCLSLLPANPVEEISRYIMHIHKFYSRLLHHLAVPFAVRVVATLNLATGPFVARCERYENWCGPLLPHVLDELLQIPAE